MQEENNRKLIFKVKIEKDDYLDLNKYYLKNRPKIQKVIHALIYMLLLFIIFSTLLPSTGFSFSLLSTGILIIAGVPILAVIFLLYYLFSSVIGNIVLKRTSNKIYESNALLKNETEYQISDSGFATNNVHGSSNYTWNELYKFCEGKTAFYLFMAQNQGHVIPKRYISLEDMKVFKDIIKSNVNKKKIHMR